MEKKKEKKSYSSLFFKEEVNPLIRSSKIQNRVTLIQSEPLVGLRLSQLMAKRLQQLNRRLRMRESDSVARVVDVLLFLAEGRGKSAATGIEIPKFPHQEIASLSGLTRETVSRVLGKLEKKGLIERSNRDVLCITDLQVLEKQLS